jgi:hypothetical protein
MPPENWIIPFSWRDHLGRCATATGHCRVDHLDIWHHGSSGTRYWVARLREILAATLADAVGLLQAGEALVEITGGTFF